MTIPFFGVSEQLHGDYVGAITGTVTVSTFSWIGAINNDGDIITLDSKNVEYYAIVSRSGISALAVNFTDALFGAVGASIATHFSGGVGVYRIVYIKFRNGKQSILRCMDEYYKYINKHCNVRTFDPEMINALKERVMEHGYLRVRRILIDRMYGNILSSVYQDLGTVIDHSMLNVINTFYFAIDENVNSRDDPAKYNTYADVLAGDGEI